jgi:hypothetical protein
VHKALHDLQNAYNAPVRLPNVWRLGAMLWHEGLLLRRTKTAPKDQLVLLEAAFKRRPSL